MVPFGAPETTKASKQIIEVKSEQRFEMSDPNYLLIHVHIVYMVWVLLASSEATTASKQPLRSTMVSDLK